MKLTKRQLEDIIEIVLVAADREIEVNGPQDFDVVLSIPEGTMGTVRFNIQSVLGKNKQNLEDLFNLQRNLQKKIDFTDISLIQYIRLMFIGIVTEACEAIEQTDWKPWKKDTGVNTATSENFKEEIIDIWHFLINLTLASGMDADDVIQKFKAKNKINIKRQEDKY